MRKKFLLMIFVLSLFTSMGGGWLHAQTKNGVSSTSAKTITLFEDGFEDDFTSLDEEFWTQIDDDGDGKKWYYENDHIISKSYYDGVGAIDPEDYIVTSSKYTLSESSELTLKIGPTHSSYNINAYRVVISEDMDSWTVVYDENFYYNGNLTSIQTRTIPLRNYSGQTVHVGVLHYLEDANGDGIKIDYIKLTGAAPTAEPVAKIGETPYNSLAEAVTAATAGQTITLIADVELAERVTIPADKTLTIDLNGKSISMEESIIATAYAINNLGNLTITDGVGGGSINARGIYNGYGDGAANVATAKITVLSGTINAKGTNGGGAAIFNYGVADIQGGTFTSIASYAIALQTGSTMTIGENAIITGGINSWQSALTITGGAISNDKSGKHVVYAGESAVTINGGTFHNNNSGNATIMASGSTAAVEITGGTFTLNIVDASSSYLIDATSSATYTISGGSFTGGIRAQGGTKYEITGGTFTNEYGNYNVYEGGDINISGGTFTGSYAQKFATDNLAAGYELGANGTVAEVVPAAKIGDNNYETFDAAYSAAKSGDVIELFETAVISKTMANYNKKTVTVKANGLETAFLVKGSVMMGTFAGMTVETDGTCITFGTTAGDYNPTVDINGGTYKGGTSAIKVVSGLVRIADGVFSATDNENTIIGDVKNVNVNGGKFYNFNPTSYIPNNRIAQQGADGYWAVAEAVAKIGDVKYATLASAIDAAQTGETVTLLRNINLGDITSAVIVKKSITIDGEGYWTITINSVNDSWNSAAFAPRGPISYTFKNLTIDLKNAASNMAAFSMKYGGTLENVTVKGAFAQAVSVSMAYPVTVTNCKFNGATWGVYASASGVKLNVTGTTFNTTGAVYMHQYGELVFTDNIIAADSYVETDATVDVSKNFWNGNNATGGAPTAAQLKGDNIICDTYYAANNNGVLGDLTDNGVAETPVIEIVADGETYKYGPSRLSLISKLLGSSAQANEVKITLLENITLENGLQIAPYIEEGTHAITPKTVEINLDDKTLTGFIQINANVTATIKNGTVTATDNTRPGVDVVGKVTLDNVTINAAKEVRVSAEAELITSAKVGKTYYATLDAAFTAATEGQTITLLADATPALTSQRAITKAAVIDLGGKTLNLTEDDLYFGTTTFKNGTIVVDPLVEPSTAVFWMFANQTLTFDNVKVVATGVTGTYLIGLDGNNSDLNLLNGSEILVENTTALDLDIICVNASTGNDIKVENSKVNVTNLDGRVFFRGNYTVKDSEVNLAGITKAGFRIEAGQKLSIEGTSKINIEGEPRDGGIHLTDLSATYTKAETATVNATVNEPKVAKVGENTYRTLAQAVAAVEDGGTITLIANETFTKNNRYDNGGWWDGLGYSGDKSFTIDLGGFTVSQDGSLNDYLFWFKNVGSKENTITIKNGTLDAGTTAFCALCTASSHENQLTINTENIKLINNISNGSTVKVRAGSVLNVKEGTKITGKNSYLGIENWNATVNIYDGAEIYMNGTSSYNGCLVGVGGNGTVNVYGGYGKGVKGGFIAMTSGGTINVKGGEWIANTDGTVGNNSNLYVLTAQSNKYESGFAGPSIINVTGGTFRGGMDAWVLNNIEGEKAELNITGGNFNANPASYVEAGYVATEAAGIYTVVEAPAYIDGKASYASLAAAYEAAVNGDVIVLNESVTTFPVINKAVTFKGGKENAAVEINYALSQNFTAIDGIVRFENLTFNKPLFTEHGGNKPGLSIEFECCNFNVNSEAGYGILIGTSWSNSVVKGLKVNNCNFEYVGTEFKGGYMLYVQCVNEVTITNNTIDGNNLYRGAIHLGDATEHATVATVSNNTIKNFCRGVMMGNRVAGSSATISNNTFDNINYSNKDSKPAQECAPIFIHSNATAAALQVALTDNKVENCANPMIYSEDTDLIKYYVTEFTGNTVGGSAVEFANSYNAPNQIFPVATINDAEYFTLQAAIDAVQNGETIVLTKDCAEVVSINKSNVAFTINGKISDTENIAYTGKIQINVGQNVTVKNINFSHAGDEAHDFIANVGSPTGKNYNTTLLVEGCSFVGGNNNYNTVAVRTIHPTHTQIKNSTGTGLHSFLQNTGGQQVTVEGVVLTDSKGGLAIGSPNGAVSVKGCDLTTNTYGVRLDANNTNAPGTTLKNNKVNAYIPVSVRKATAANYVVTVEGDRNNYAATNSDGVWFAACTTEYEDGVALNEPTGKVKVILNDANLNAAGVYGDYVPVAKIGDVEYTSLEAAFKAATSGCTIEILSDVTVDYNWDARNTGGKFTVPVTINGNGKTIKFTASVNDNNYQAPFRFEADATVKNLIVDMSAATDNRFRAISSKGNLTVDNCNFIGKDESLNCRAIIFGEGAGANVGNLAISITNSEFINWKRGITDNENAQDVKTVTITGNTLTDAGVGVSAKETVTFTGNTVAGAYVNIKSYTAGNKLAVTATDNTLEANTDAAYNVIDAGGVVNAQDRFVVIPKGGNLIAYTGADGIWGEVWGNARESFVIKVLDAEGNVMGSTSLNNIGGIINGNVNVTWNLKFNAVANTDEYWTMAWTTAPTVDNMPAKAQLWVDGKMVSEGNVVLNGPDDINKINVVTTNANGNIVTCHTSFVDAVAAGNNVAILKAGTYALKVKDGLTITGAVDGVEFANIGAFGCNGANVTFNNVTFTYANNSTYKGLQHSGNLVYNNCTFNGQVFLYGASETFNNCTFNTTDSNNYNVWTYGAKKVAFNECTFNSAGKSVLIYAESASVFNDVTVTACTFIASTAVDGKAAIEMDSSLTGGINLTIDAETTASGFGKGNVSDNSLWNNKKGNADVANNDITVKVGDVVVLAPIYEAQIGETKYRKLADAFAAAQAGDVVKVFAGTYAMPAMKAGIKVEGAVNADGTPAVLFNGTLKGTLENLTMKNIHIKGGNAQRWAYAKGNLVFENVTFEATSVYALHFDGIAAGTNLTYTNCTIIGWAAMGGSPASCTFDGCTIKGNGTYGVIRTYFDATIKNCTFDVANVNTTDVYQDGIHAVEGAQVVVENCTNANGDMKDLVNVHANSVVTVDGVAIKNAAKINDNYYRTLAEAIDAIGSGNVVIELLDDATLNYGAREAYGTAETTSLTINGNGKVLTLNQTNSDWSSFGLANAEAKVVFNNMTIEKTGKGDTSGAWNTHAIIFSSNVEMNEVTVNNAIAVQDGATLNNVTINEANGYYGLWINGNGQTVTMNGGSITATNGGRGIKIADQYIDVPAQVTLNVTGTDFNTAKKAAVLVSSKAGAEITASNVNIEDVTADKVNFVWVDEDWAANFGNVEVTGATVAQEGIENFVAEVKKDAKVEGYYASLQAAVNAVQNGETTITLINDVTENVTVSQNNGINIVIDGQNHNFSGTITIDGNSRTTGESLTIQNVNFVTNVASLYFIDANSTENTDRYPHNVTVKDCTFTAEENSAAVNTAVAMRFRQGFNIAVENVTAVRLHSLMQNYGVSGVTVNDVEVDGKNGIALGTSTNVTVTDATIKAVGYGLRVDASVTTPITIEDSEIKAFIPVVVRKATANTNITFNGTNTMTETNTDGYWCVIGTSEYEEDGKLPTAATGNVFVSLNDEDLNYKGIYGHYAVAQIGDVKYATLQAAVNAVQNGETITVIRDIALTEAITVAAGKVVTLDLNGNVVSYTSATPGEDMITVKGGTLVINDSKTTGKITYVNTDQTAANVTVSTISVEPNSTLTVNGGTIENKTDKADGSSIYSYAIDILTNGNLGDVNVTINGGTVYSDYMAIRQFNNSDVCKNTLVVNGGYIYGNRRAIQIHFKNNAAYTTISGGKIEANDYSLCFLTTSENILVEGGEFIGAVWYSGTKSFIKGGTYTTDVTEYVAPGYSCKQNTEGKYVVKFANVEIYYTAAGVETTKEQAAYSLSFAVTDYDNKEASVKIGSKKPTTKDRIEIVTPATVAFEGVEYKVTSLANKAFDGVRGIKEIIISEGVKSLGSRALANMYELVDVVFPSTLVSVGDNCFTGYGDNHKIKTITCLAATPPTASGHWETASFQMWVAENVILFVAGDANVYKKAAGWSRFTNILGINSEIEIPGNYYLYTMKVNVTSVSPRAASIKIGRRFPEGVPAILDTIPEKASFYGIEFPITSIPEKGFQGVKFEKIVIPGNIKNIGNTAFGGSNLADTLIIEEGVETLGNFAFQGCYSLSEIILPSTLKSVGEKCFNNVGVASTNYEAVEVSLVYTGVTPPTAGANLFSNNIQGTLYVPNPDVVESFKAAAGWNISSIKPFEAKIGETVYYSLAKAIKASKAGDVITLIADVETAKANPIIIQEGVTLDINTHNITANIYGTVKTAGGLWTTVAVPGFNSRDMLGKNAIYNTTGATVVNLANEVKVLAGTIVLNPHPEEEWWTLPGQSLSIATDATFEIPAGVKFTVREGNANVNGTLINKGTLAINAGATVTGNLTGDIHFLGGNFITADGYKMVGTTSEYFYNATNALVNIESTFGDITILSGAMTLGQSWRTVQGQTLTVAEGASFTVPTGKTFEVFANTHVVVEGTLVTEGTVYLQAGATVRAEAGLNIQTTVAGHVVDYNNGVYSVVEQTIFTQTIQLNAGWNWFSSYVETDLESLQAALGTNGVMIKTGDYFNEYLEGWGWDGNIESVSSSQMYMIQTSVAHELVLSGKLLENVEITLNNGWNWISFPMNTEVSVTEALANLQNANTGDIIKNGDAFAEYLEGWGWDGTLSTLEPGQGYMYYSNNETPVTFTYSPSSSKSAAKANVTTDGNYWTPNAAQFANNMTMTAVLDVENINYEVAAFVNGECRGSARPIYVEALDAYMLFLTIHGEEVEEMTFKYYDIDTDTEYTLSDRINYSNNAILGSLKEPYMFTRGTTGIGEAELSQLNIYPNPTTTAAEINLNATFDKVEVFNALGVKVAEYSNVDSIDALETAGIYVIRATNNSIISHCRLVVK